MISVNLQHLTEATATDYPAEYTGTAFSVCRVVAPSGSVSIFLPAGKAEAVARAINQALAPE